MKFIKSLTFFSIILWFQFNYSQDFSNLWEGHFSFYEVNDVCVGQNKIYGAAQNAILIYDPQTNQINTITTVQGLSGEDISTIYYSEISERLLIGYQSGLIEVYSDVDQSVLSVVDIVEKQNITSENKIINHFYEYDGLVYISTDYGISVYNLDQLEFGDTYFIGDNGSQISVKQTTIFNNEIYAACYYGNGIKKADLNNPNLIDYNQWQNIAYGSFLTISTFNDKVYSVKTDNSLLEIDGNAFSTVLNFEMLPLDGEISESNLIYTAANATYVYNENLQLVNSFQSSETSSDSFTSAIRLDDNVYIGTSDKGVIKVGINNITDYTEIRPSGPLENNIFKLDATTNTVWASFGEYTSALNPYPITSKGISYLYNDVWESLPYDSLFQASELNVITPNVFNPNQVFISSFFNGLLEINNFEPTILYNETNSGLESLILDSDPNYVDIRVSATEFDVNGLLWTLTSFVDQPLKSYNPISGNWQAYSFSDLIDPPSEENGFFDIEIDNNGTKWIGSYDNGLLAYNESVSNNPLRNINSSAQNVEAFTRFISLAIDNNNQLWIGTTKGLRVLYNTLGFYNDPSPTLSQIIILEDGIAKELLDDQIITDIEVDGSNNKWISTIDSGVFYFSSDGQTTIYHFTEDNSPLPSNTINDVSLDSDNGIVYIASNKGLLAFKAGGSKTEDTLEEAFVYPNPVRPEYNILGFNDLNDITKGVKVSGLTDNVNIKITDIEGNLVAEAQSNINLRSSNANYNFAIDGGTAVWNGKNLGNSVVRTGVYLILISDLDSFETKVLKVLIVR
ncbi:ABC transporter substrate-binding protein [Winogradskyella litoriviva]|uniref:ABC transporter substrate-binding protein n=1 Tax=Winogradskyella litoriviva TaxID=1220182 RepID=A0ABX2E1D8_9FLAO|nr:ABC transporter substrate-binding protein [Winogradskyella litoriviva]NRD22029.1 ABC transporter substrate-binding protein [Winogradskyella litoriviva]